MSAVDLHRLTSDPTPKTLFGFDVIDPLGEGAGSSIYVVSDRATHQIYALKHVVRRTEKDARFIEQLENEFAVSRTFAHPSLRKSIDIKLNKTWLGKVTEAALVMELFDGLPMDVIPPKGVAEALAAFIQASQGLEAPHAAGYVPLHVEQDNLQHRPSDAAKVDALPQA